MADNALEKLKKSIESKKERQKFAPKYMLVSKTDENYAEIFVISDLFLGITDEKAKAKSQLKDENLSCLATLESHLKIIEQNYPNAMIIINGNIFKHFSATEKKDLNLELRALYTLLKPYKSKIISICDGYNEKQYKIKNSCIIYSNKKNKEKTIINVSPLYILSKMLGLQNKYQSSANFEIELNLNNEYTNHTNQKICILCTNGYGLGETFKSTLDKLIKLQKEKNGYDAYILSGYRNSMISKCSELVDSSNPEQKLIKNFVLISTSGYLSKRIRSNTPAYVDNKLYRFAVVKNLDANNIKGKNNISQTPYKLTVDRLDLSLSQTSQAEYDITQKYLELKKINQHNAQFLIDYIQNVLKEINEENLRDMVQEIKHQEQSQLVTPFNKKNFEERER